VSVSLRGRVAVVTGAASGIGLGLCERFAAEGMQLVISDVGTERLTRAAACLEALGVDVLAVPTDVASWESVESLAAQAFDRFGAVHLLCNNAGVTRPATAWECSREDWSWVLGVNLNGVFHGIRAFVPRMIERGEPGHVVNTASTAGLVAHPGVAAYTASKHAIVGLSESLYHDLRRRGLPIGVSVLCPGAVTTGLRANSRELNPAADHAAIPDLPESATAISPEAVAGHVVDAVLAGRFWILTHPGYRAAIELRARGVLDSGEAHPPTVS